MIKNNYLYALLLLMGILLPLRHSSAQTLPTTTDEPDVTLCQAGQKALLGNCSDATSFMWSPTTGLTPDSDPKKAQITVSPTETTVYTRTTTRNTPSGVVRETWKVRVVVVTPDYIQKYLESEGFIKIPCSILREVAFTDVETRGIGDVLDYATSEIQFAGSTFKGKEKLLGIVNDFNTKGYKSSGYITKNSNFCDTKFREVNNKYKEDLTDEDIWWHFYDVPNSKDDFWYLKVKNYELYLEISILSKLKDRLVRPSGTGDCKGGSPGGNIVNGKRPDLEDGTLAHWIIQLDYKTNNTAALIEYRIPKASKSGSGTGKADIVIPITGELFEIKQRYQLDSAKTQSRRYVKLANLHCPNTPIWRLGHSENPIPLKPKLRRYPINNTITKDKELVAWLEESGAILYEYRNKDPNSPDPVTIPALPQNIFDSLKEYLKNRGRSIEDTGIEIEIADFLTRTIDRKYVVALKGAIIATGVIIVVTSIANDLSVVGILDDWASFQLAYRLVLVAQTL